MSSRRFRGSIWGKLSKLAFRKKEGSRKRRVFRTSLLEQFEKRELMAFEVTNIQLVSDTGISATDKITYDPRLQGTVANSSGGGLGGLPGGPPSLISLHVQFDHQGDGIGDGSTIVDSSMNFQYDPRTSDPGLSFYVGPFSPKYRILEYDNFNNLMATGSWNTFSMTLETVASGEIQVQDALYNNLPHQGSFHFGDADVGATLSRTFTITNTASPSDPNAILRLNTANVQLPPGFSITQPFANTVAPGAQTTFTVSVDTSVAGPRWGTFSFGTSDSDENPFVLSFTADVLSLAPEIDIRNEATGASLVDGSGSINFGSTELANAALNEWLAMTQANAQHDLDYDTEVTDAELDKEVNTKTAKSEQTVATYETFKERMTDFSNSLGDAWGSFNLAKAAVEVIFQQLLKVANILRTSQAVAEFLDYWTDYFQQVKDLVTNTATAEKTLVSGVLGDAKTYINGTNTKLKSLSEEQSDIFKALQIGLSDAYRGWQTRLAEIRRDKLISDAKAERDYLKKRAQVLESLEPSFAYARKNLAIAEAKFNAGQITASDWTTAQSSYASTIAGLDTQIVTLTAPHLVTKRTEEGEAIRVLTVETAKAEQTWNTNASTALTTWATNSGNKIVLSAGDISTKGETFVTDTTTKQKTAIGSVEDEQKSFVDDTTDKEAETEKDVTSIDNAFFLKLAQLLGDLLIGKIDARSAYESLQADNHKTKKEASHQASPSALTDLQRSVATADSAKYATRRTANQQKAQAAKSESVSLTSKLNTADQDYVDGVADKDNSTTSGFADKAAESNKSVGGAQADLGKDIGKANITRGKEDIDVAITHRNDLIQAEIDHIARVQTAKVTQAEKVGQANKDLHIAGYTQAATQTANGLIADAQTEFNTKAKDSRVLRAGDIGDAAITAAESYAGNAAIQAGSWNTATEQYTNTSNSAATTWTTGTNTLSESYAQRVTTHGADWDVKVVKAYRDALADSGTSDVSWITTLTNADATRTGAQATAQASWVTNQVQAGASSLLWSGGDSTSTNASGTWVTQYAPVRTAKIVATSLIDAARQVASWFDSKEEANKQANADVKFVEDVKDPNTQVATSLTEHEGTARASANTSGNDLSEDIDSSQRRIRNAVVSIESTRAIDEAKAQKKRDVALAGLAEGASTTAVDKTYQDDMAKALFAWQQGYANLTYDEGSEQLKAVTETITEFGQAAKKYVEDTAGDEKLYTDALAPIIGTRTVSYIQAGIALLKASTGADNIWRNNTAQAWATHTGGDLTARGNTQRGVANASSLLADASRASIAEHKAQWWQTEIPNYLQWSADVGAIETTYTDDTTDNILQRAIGVKNAGVKYATDVGIAIKDYDVNTAAAREEYISSLMTIAKSIGDKLLDAQRDKEIALADAELQKQLTGNESAYSSAVQAANDAYTNTTTSEEASRKSQEQTALSTMNTKLSNELKNKDADIAAAEREYDQAVASLDAQYGSESSKGDTGVEGATRRSAIKTRDAQYYAARDTSWANTLSGSTTLGTSPWTVKAISTANGQAAHSVSRANVQAAHDAAMLDAIEDWQLSSRESLTDLLFTNGQSRESYNVATSNVYANWGNGVGNLLGDKPEGTGWGMPVGKFAGSGNEGNNQKTGNREFAQYIVGDETGQPEGTANGDSESQTPQLPNRDNIVPRLEFDFFWIGGYRPTRESIKRQDTWIREGIPDSEEAQRSLVAYAFFTNLIGLSDYRQMCLCQAAVQDHLGLSNEIRHDEGGESLLEEQKRAAAGIVDNSMFKQYYENAYIQSQLPNTTLFAVPNVDSIRDQFNLEISSRRGTTGYSNGADAAPFADTVIIEVATLPLQFVPFGKVMPASAARGPILSGFDMPVQPQTASGFFRNSTQLLDNADGIPLQKVVNNAPVSGAMTAEAKLAARTMTKAEWKAFNRAERLGRTAESWTTTRQNTWKAIAERELANPTGQYSSANLRRMVEGLAPKVRVEVTSNKTGLTTVREISMELHHRSLPQRFRTPTANEAWNLEPVYPWSHQGMDPFRHTGYKLERIINGTNSF